MGRGLAVQDYKIDEAGSLTTPGAESVGELQVHNAFAARKGILGQGSKCVEELQGGDPEAIAQGVVPERLERFRKVHVHNPGAPREGARAYVHECVRQAQA